MPFGRRLAALAVDLAGYVLGTIFAGFVLTARNVALPAWLLLAGTFAAWFVLVPLATGATPGKWLLRLRLVADGGGLVAWRLTLRALLLGAFVLPLLAALFLAVLIVLDEPWPYGLFALAHDPGAQGAEAVFTTLGPVQLLAVAAGFALTVTCALETLRHPDLLGPHDHASGIRNAALPHSRAAVADEQPPGPDPVRTPETASGAR
ncbi:PE-PGRS family protein [Streptomyces himastatinicus ATCC 53653]|uniref:PE-PGRS family protein n=1 Tax=Streptomyces himastatinicus ATCC 53653 TaxID=457427 RepID=D9WGH8_9ACTN|nr:PE-PGRS family protein [Streptomyces himastatinicus ATCC 53653]